VRRAFGRHGKTIGNTRVGRHVMAEEPAALFPARTHSSLFLRHRPAVPGAPANCVPGAPANCVPIAPPITPPIWTGDDPAAPPPGAAAKRSCLVRGGRQERWARRQGVCSARGTLWTRGAPAGCRWGVIWTRKRAGWQTGIPSSGGFLDRDEEGAIVDGVHHRVGVLGVVAGALRLCHRVEAR